MQILLILPDIWDTSFPHVQEVFLYSSTFNNNNNTDKLSWRSSILIKAELLTNLTRREIKSNRKHSCLVQRRTFPLPSALPEQVQKNHRPLPALRGACKQVQPESTAEPHTAEESPSTASWKLAGVAYAGVIFFAYIIYYLGCFSNLILNLVGDFQHNWRADTLFPRCIEVVFLSWLSELLLSC